MLSSLPSPVHPTPLTLYFSTYFSHPRCPSGSQLTLYKNATMLSSLSSPVHPTPLTLYFSTFFPHSRCLFWEPGPPWPAHPHPVLVWLHRRYHPRPCRNFQGNYYSHPGLRYHLSSVGALWCSGSYSQLVIRGSWVQIPLSAYIPLDKAFCPQLSLSIQV